MILRIGSFVRFFLLLVVLITSLQLIGFFLPIYNYFDELLLIILTLIAIPSFKHLTISKIKLTLIIILTSLLVATSVLNFYAFEPVFIKLVYYIKSAYVFFLIPFLSRIYGTELLNNRIFVLIVALCFISIFEFLLIQYYYFGSGVQYDLLGVFLKSRDGIYRAASLTGHPINLGLVALIGVIYLFERFKKKHIILLLILLFSLLFSGSRIPMLLTVFYFGIKIMDLKLPFTSILKFKHAYVCIIPVVVIFLAAQIPGYLSKNNEIKSTRGITISLGQNLLNNPLYATLGTGIGSYGMYESVEYGSPIYNQLDYPNSYRRILITGNRSTGMESYFFMMIFEIGILATFLYFFILIPFGIKFNILNVFFASIIIVISLVYPIYTLPFIYMFTILFPNYSSE